MILQLFTSYLKNNEIVAFPIRSEIQFYRSLLFWKATIVDENTRFCGSLLIWKATILDENTRICGSLLIWKATILNENTRCWTKIHDFAARFLFENRRFWTKIRDFAAVTGYAPRAARGAQWRVLSGSKTRHIIHFSCNFVATISSLWKQKCDFRSVQRSAFCRSRRELANAYLRAEFGFDTAENEPSEKKKEKEKKRAL